MNFLSPNKRPLDDDVFSSPPLTSFTIDCGEDVSDEDLVNVIDAIEFNNQYRSGAHNSSSSSSIKRHRISAIPDDDIMDDLLIRAAEQCEEERLLVRAAEECEVERGLTPEWSSHAVRNIPLQLMPTERDRVTQFCRSGHGNGIVIARAGSGKTQLLGTSPTHDSLDLSIITHSFYLLITYSNDLLITLSLT